jgi:hypothetical protein
MKRNAFALIQYTTDFFRLGILTFFLSWGGGGQAVTYGAEVRNLCWLAGRYDNPMPELTIFPS